MPGYSGQRHIYIYWILVAHGSIFIRYFLHFIVFAKQMKTSFLDNVHLLNRNRNYYVVHNLQMSREMRIEFLLQHTLRSLVLAL